MRPVDVVSIAICVVIVAGVFFSVWKHGRGNPETTGSLARQMRKYSSKIDSLEQSLEGCATRGALDLLAEQVSNLRASSASSGEVVALEMKIQGLEQTLSAKIDAVAKAADRTEAGVQRIEGYFLQRGVNGS